MKTEWLSGSLIHLLYFIAVLYLVGFLIALVNRAFYRLSGGGRVICYLTGLIGTPIHELSHALMCLLFGHSIREMRLFRIDLKSGVLGYVNHTYNRRNLYHVIGNYFIGIAPILGGTCFLLVMLKLLMPEASTAFGAYLSDFVEWQMQGLIPEQFLGVGAVFVSFLTILFSSAEGWHFWVFLLLALCVSIHMNLSWSDIRGSLLALPLLAALLTLCHLALYYLSADIYEGFVRALNRASGYLAGILMLSLTLSILALIPALLLRLLRSAFLR